MSKWIQVIRFHKITERFHNKGEEMEEQFFDLNNASYLITLIRNELLKYANKESVDTAIANAMDAITGGMFKKVEVLPTIGEVGKIYLIPTSKPEEGNVSDEYIWDPDAEKYEFIGTTKVSLDGYVKETDIQTVKNSEIQTLWDAAFTTTS